MKKNRNDIRGSTMHMPTFSCSVGNFIEYGIPGLVDPAPIEMTKKNVFLEI
jgi:hypothetical protein